MSVSFKTMQAELIESRIQQPVSGTIYLVLAWNGNGGYWKVFAKTISEQYATLEKAEAHAKRLDGIWSHVHIAKIDLPGKETQRD